jgi:HEAT repeats
VVVRELRVLVNPALPDIKGVIRTRHATVESRGASDGNTRPGKFDVGTQSAGSIHESESWKSASTAGRGRLGHGVRNVRLFLIPLTVLALTAPAQAGIFRKSNKPNPAVHVPALLEVLKNGKDEKARATAASELRDYDAKSFPDILPALVDALNNDPSPIVRSEAAEAIGKIRPISPQAGFALEQAKANDKSVAVKLSARTALLQYRILGYFGGGKGEMAAAQTAEPPLATGSGARGTPGSTVLRPTPTPAPVGGPVMPGTSRPTVVTAKPTSLPSTPASRTQTAEPPLADAPAKVIHGPSPTDVGKPAPIGPTPLLTVQPRSPAPAVVIPPAPPKEPPANGPTLPAPKSLPSDLDKPAAKPGKPVEDGPTIGPPPPKG